MVNAPSPKKDNTQALQHPPLEEHDLVPTLLEIITNASNLILEIRKTGFKTDIKTDSSPVTEADEASENYILQELRAKYPHIPAIAEEESASGIYIQPSHYYWLIDPLDGTCDFAEGTDNFTVNIGLIEGNKPRFGVVALPAYGEFYIGGVNIPAERITKETRALIKVSPPPQEGLRVLTSHYHHSEKYLSKLVKEQPIQTIEPMGSAAKIMRIAEGNADFYPRFGPTMEWDTAAPQAILEAAGGYLLDQHGNPLLYGKKDWKNPPFYCSNKKY